MEKLFKKLITAVALVAIALSASALTISWDANSASENVTKYHIFMATNNGQFSKIASVTNTTYTITNIAPGVYKFYLMAENFWGLSSAPSVTNGTPVQASAPAVPVLYVIVGNQTNSIINLQ
jgi:predicted phage tail protein